MTGTVYHLEPFPRFLQRVVELNRLHVPDDPVHDAVLEDTTEVDGVEEAKRTLHQIHRRFPNGEPAHMQAAYLVRAFSGLRPFPEANHRTGWDLTSEVLRHAGHTIVASDDEGRALGNSLYAELEDFDADSLGVRDARFQALADWFKPRIAAQ